MKMKRILAVALALAMGLSMISCSQSTEREETQPQQTEQVEQPAKMPEEKPTEKPTEKTKVNLAALSGPTALGMLELLEQNEKGEAANDYQVTLATAPDEVVAKVVSGELDIAAVPTNVAATLYNKTQGGVQLAALNTMCCTSWKQAKASSRWQTSRVRPSTPPDKALHRSMPSIWCWKRTG